MARKRGSRRINRCDIRYREEKTERRRSANVELEQFSTRVSLCRREKQVEKSEVRGKETQESGAEGRVDERRRAEIQVCVRE